MTRSTSGTAAARTGPSAASPARGRRRRATPARRLGWTLCALAPFILGLLPGSACGDAASAGVAGAYTLRARGVEAASWNPANLGWNGAFDFQIVAVQIQAGNNSFSLADYNKWNGTSWSDQDKEQILSRIPGADFEGRFALAADAPGLAMKGWALTIESEAFGDARIPREFAQLLLDGDVPGQSFRLNHAGGGGMAWSEARLSHGRRIATVAGVPIVAGLSLKYLQGWGYAGITNASGGFTTGADEIQGAADLTARTAQGGTGYGADVGVAGRLPSGWDLSLGVRDLGSSIRWNRKTEIHHDTATADSITLNNVQNNGTDLVAQSSSIEPGPGFKTALPSTATLAAGRSWLGAYVEADLTQPLNDVFGLGTKPTVALGASRRILGFLEPRLGWSAGGPDGTVYAGGLGLRLLSLELDLAVSSTGGLTSPKGIGGAFGLAWKGSERHPGR